MTLQRIDTITKPGFEVDGKEVITGHEATITCSLDDVKLLGKAFFAKHMEMTASAAGSLVCQQTAEASHLVAAGLHEPIETYEILKPFNEGEIMNFLGGDMSDVAYLRTKQLPAEAS